MKRILLFSVIVVLALAMGMGMGAAQENETSNETADEIEDELGDRGAIVDQYVTLEDWTYSDGRFELEFDAEMSTPIQATPAQPMSEGSVQVTWVEEMVPRGGGTVSVPAEMVSGEAAVQISTRNSRSEQRAVRISTGTVENNPLAYFGGESGVFSGIGLSVGTSAMAAWFVLRRENKGAMRGSP